MPVILGIQTNKYNTIWHLYCSQTPWFCLFSWWEGISGTGIIFGALQRIHSRSPVRGSKIEVTVEGIHRQRNLRPSFEANRSKQHHIPTGITRHRQSTAIDWIHQNEHWFLKITCHSFRCDRMQRHWYRWKATCQNGETQSGWFGWQWTADENAIDWRTLERRHPD